MFSEEVNSKLSPEVWEQPGKDLREALKSGEKANAMIFFAKETKNRLAIFKELRENTCNRN